MLEQIAALETALEAVTQRTGHLDVAAGGLRTAREQLVAHEAALAAQLAAEPAGEH